MPRIRQLSSSVVTKIAAGEVIERPASVVKELLENSIDAGSPRIDIDIEQGGANLIRVVDDGCGILPEDMRLAFANHATSKLPRQTICSRCTRSAFAARPCGPSPAWPRCTCNRGPPTSQKGPRSAAMAANWRGRGLEWQPWARALKCAISSTTRRFGASSCARLGPSWAISAKSSRALPWPARACT